MTTKVLNRKSDAQEDLLNAVYVGRPSKWGNPFEIGRDGTREEVIQKYAAYLFDSGLVNDIHELRGRDLACWCAPEPCHADILLELANDDEDIDTSDIPELGPEFWDDAVLKPPLTRKETPDEDDL